ncbi:hypothetical protein AAVH_26296 [Aphelenchoides avenae]|nr:hypothetical protein AAVH_26296 [Aphelenchus avenae]
MTEVGAKKKICFCRTTYLGNGDDPVMSLPTDVDEEAVATTLLLDACRYSRLKSIRLYGTTPMNADFFAALEQRAPSIFFKKFYTGSRTLADGKLTITAGKHVDLLNYLICTCLKVGVTFVSHWTIGLVKKLGSAIIENALLEFSFGDCE